MRRMRVACWITKATNTYSEGVALTAASLQQWLHESISLLRNTYTASAVMYEIWESRGAFVLPVGAWCSSYCRLVVLQERWLSDFIHSRSSIYNIYHFFSYWRYNPLWVCILQPSSTAIASSLKRFLDHTQRRATVRRTPLDEWSVRRRDLYLRTHNTHNKHPCPRWDSKPRSQQASGRRPTP